MYRRIPCLTSFSNSEYIGTDVPYPCLSQHQCIKNLTAILEAAGSSIEKVVKVNVFLSDMADFAAVGLPSVDEEAC